MQNQDSQTEETVTLLLENKRFKINKKKLIKESRYFATLLSTTYADHRLSEHFINYEIPLISFQDFIKWINSDTHNTIKDFERNDLGHLLTLLDLSVLFAVDNLIKNRFTELPRNLIFKLSRQNFLKLVGNSNLRVPDESELYLHPVVIEWMQINQDTIPLDILKKTGPKVYSSIICYNGSNSSVNNEFYIHCWDGDKLFELTTFKYPEAIINNNAITGMQITARGHHLYLSGGEFGIGTGRFNTYVWRYSLITKRWFLETIMPCARRHMIAAFLQNKLLLAGGVGHYRCKLRSLDIYNIHKGTWVKGAILPMEFVTIPAYYVFDKKLIVYMHNIKKALDLPFVFIYFCDSNEWYSVPVKIDYELRLDIRELSETMPIKFKTASCYIDDNKPNRINLRTIMITCDNLEYRHEIYKKVNVSSDQDVSQVYFHLLLSHTDLYENSVLICLKNNNYILLLLGAKKEMLQWHSIPIQNQDKFCSLLHSDTIFFNLMDPANLHVMSATNLECTT